MYVEPCHQTLSTFVLFHTPSHTHTHTHTITHTHTHTHTGRNVPSYLHQSSRDCEDSFAGFRGDGPGCKGRSSAGGKRTRATWNVQGKSYTCEFASSWSLFQLLSLPLLPPSHLPSCIQELLCTCVRLFPIFSLHILYVPILLFFFPPFLLPSLPYASSFSSLLTTLSFLAVQPHANLTPTSRQPSLHHTLSLSFLPPSLPPSCRVHLPVFSGTFLSLPSTFQCMHT